MCQNVWNAPDRLSQWIYPACPVGPEGIKTDGYSIPVSPDGKSFIARSGDHVMIFSVEGGEPRPVPGLSEDDHVIRWSADGRSLFVSQGQASLKVYRLDLSTGRRDLWKEITPADVAGAMDMNLMLTPDGRGYLYTVDRHLSDLYLAEA